MMTLYKTPLFTLFPKRKVFGFLIVCLFFNAFLACKHQ